LRRRFSLMLPFLAVAALPGAEPGAEETASPS
jgi:hypothetical protein